MRRGEAAVGGITRALPISDVSPVTSATFPDNAIIVIFFLYKSEITNAAWQK
jgi:hypothetical protein